MSCDFTRILAAFRSSIINLVADKCWILPSFVPVVGGCSKLRTLSLSRRFLDNSQLACLLRQLPPILDLELLHWSSRGSFRARDDDEGFNEDVLQAVGLLTSLTYLHIEDTNFPVAYFTHLASLTNLQSLELRHCQMRAPPETLDLQLSPLLALTNLTMLHFMPRGSRFTLPPSFLHRLSAVPSMSSLQLVLENLEEFVEVARLTTVTYLSVFPVGIGTRVHSFYPVVLMPNLQVLELRLEEFTSCLMVLNHLPNLRALSMSARDGLMTVRDTTLLAMLRQLVSLSIYGPEFIDGSFASLCLTQTNLTRLHIEAANLVEDDLMWIDWMGQLKELHFMSCDGLCEEAVDALLNTHPNLDVVTCVM